MRSPKRQRIARDARARASLARIRAMLRSVFERASYLMVTSVIALWACSAERTSTPQPAAPAKEAPPPAPPAGSPPRFVPGSVPVAPFVAEQLLDQPPGARTLVYVGATWCEPCQHFHRAVEAGELDAVLPDVRFIEYDIDLAKPALAEAGYQARLIPIFARPGSDGRASGTIVAGSIKGEGAVQNIVPRLHALLVEPQR